MNLNLNRQPDVRNNIDVSVKITAERRHSKSSQDADLERRKGAGGGFTVCFTPICPPSPICGNSKLELVNEITYFFRQNHDCANNVKAYTDVRNVNKHIKISLRVAKQTSCGVRLDETTNNCINGAQLYHINSTGFNP